MQRRRLGLAEAWGGAPALAHSLENARGFRTITILPETGGRVAETFVDLNQKVAAGQPLFRLDSTAQEAAVEANRRKIAEVEADMVVAQAQLRDPRVRHAGGTDAPQSERDFAA